MKSEYWMRWSPVSLGRYAITWANVDLFIHKNKLEYLLNKNTMISCQEITIDNGALMFVQTSAC